MTLADLCTSLIERDSVIYTFRGTSNREAARIHVTQEQITYAAKSLKTFTRRELVTAAGCSFGAVQHWEKVNKGKLVDVGRVIINGGTAIIWRWL